jgi:hypothetical protein
VLVFLQVVKAMMVFWTAGFVLMTLGINAPMLPFVLRVLGLSKVCAVLAWVGLCVPLSAYTVYVRVEPLCLALAGKHLCRVR